MLSCLKAPEGEAAPDIVLGRRRSQPRVHSHAHAQNLRPRSRLEPVDLLPRSVGLHMLARARLLPQRAQHVAAVGLVVVAQHTLDVGRRLLRVVVRHLAEKVVRDVRVGDVVEEHVQEAVAAVHGAHGAAQPVPLALSVVGQGCTGQAGEIARARQRAAAAPLAAGQAAQTASWVMHGVAL